MYGPAIPLALKSCRILWSTQSGRAKACARRTRRILTEQSALHVEDIGSSFDEKSEPFTEWVSSMDPSCFLLLFVSTTGDGEHCDSIRDTWKTLLSKSLPMDLFQGKQFALFCLGDRAYGPQFCAAGRKLAVRLLQLGMTRCCDVGYGDDNTPNGGVFRDLDDWLEMQLLPLFERLEEQNSPLSESLPPNPFKITFVDAEADKTAIEEWQQPLFHEAYQTYFRQSCPVTAYSYDKNTCRRSETVESNRRGLPLLGKVLENRRITRADWDQDTRHLCIQLQSVDDRSLGDVASLPYLAGDIASILPFNSDGEVDRFLAVLPQRIQDVADRPFQLDIDPILMNNGFTRWPQLSTLRGWLKYCADIHSLPEREDLRSISFYCASDDELGKAQRDKLRALSETSEAGLYADYILREKRSWADVLYDFESLRVPSSKLSVEALLALLPSMRPRDFSIASAPSKTLQHSGPGFGIELCVAIVQGKTRLGRRYHGLCSEYLSRMVQETGYLQAWIRPGSFQQMPLEMHDNSSSFQVPILCVGAGTGVAPMRSLLLEREAISSKNATDQEHEDKSDSNILVFGCRKSDADFYYQQEWETLCNRQSMKLLTAFSRDQFQKIYVQKVLREADDGALIAKHLLERGGALYIAGGPKMARAVKEEVIEALANHLDGGEKGAKQFLNKLQQVDRKSVV